MCKNPTHILRAITEARLHDSLRDPPHFDGRGPKDRGRSPDISICTVKHQKPGEPTAKSKGWYLQMQLFGTGRDQRQNLFVHRDHRSPSETRCDANPLVRGSTQPDACFGHMNGSDVKRNFGTRWRMLVSHSGNRNDSDHLVSLLATTSFIY
jgi:hypothetical protein